MDGTVLMVTWKLYDNDGEKWDKLLSLFEYRAYAQLYQWGEYKKKLGWHVLRLIGENEAGNCTALAQGLYKVYPFGMAIMWVPGGPVGDIASINNELFDTLFKYSDCRYLYCRISPSYYMDGLNENLFWNKVKSPLNSCKSMIIKLEGYDLADKYNLTRNWKKNLKRSGNYSLSSEVIENPDGKAIEQIYRDMEQYKGINTQYSTTELENIFKYLFGYLTIYVCKNSEGIPIAVRGCIIHNDKAWDFIAASNQEGRKKYASYKLMWNILEHCKMHNVNTYDLGGIDPINNAGVWNFKKGTGATEIKYIGEYENASMPVLAPLINLYIKYLK